MFGFVLCEFTNVWNPKFVREQSNCSGLKFLYIDGGVVVMLRLEKSLKRWKLIDTHTLARTHTRWKRSLWLNSRFRTINELCVCVSAVFVCASLLFGYAAAVLAKASDNRTFPLSECLTIKNGKFSHDGSVVVRTSGANVNKRDAR